MTHNDINRILFELQEHKKKSEQAEKSESVTGAAVERGVQKGLDIAISLLTENKTKL